MADDGRRPGGPGVQQGLDDLAGETAVLRELEHRGWVSRHPHPGHGRILQAELTADGQRTLTACHQAVDAVEGRMLAGLAPAERRQLAVALRSCIDGLSAGSVSPG